MRNPNPLTTEKVDVALPARGREAAVERILEAAEKLFAELPPSEVTTRAIAEMAQVNLALIHRYVGPKDAVLKAVMYRYAERFRGDIQLAQNLQDGVLNMFTDAKQEAFLRTLAFLILTRYPLDQVLSPEGGVKALLKASAVKKNAQSANALAALALGMGWTLFEEFLIKSSGSSKSTSKVRQQIFEIMREMLGK